MFRPIALALVAITWSAVPLAPAVAQPSDYPNRPLRIISPFVAGGSTDTLARLVADKLKDRLRQSVLVENRPGAASLTAIQYVSKQPPDGYTFILPTTTVATLPSLNPNANYNPTRDLTPVATVASSALQLVIHPSVPANSVAEFIAYARANPAKINIGVAGLGSFDHLVGEAFMRRSNLKLSVVPYKGDASVMPDLLEGRVNTVFLGASVSPAIASGRLRLLAVSTATRRASTPDVPTMAESGLPGFDLGVWYGILGPAGIPRDIVAKLNGEINAVLKEPSTAERIRPSGQQPLILTPSQFEALVKRDYEELGKMIREAGIKVE